MEPENVKIILILFIICSKCKIGILKNIICGKEKKYFLPKHSGVWIFIFKGVEGKCEYRDSHFEKLENNLMNLIPARII